MKIDTYHPDFTKILPTWEKINDVIAGEDTIKSRRTKYLPMPNAHDTSPANQERYQHYLDLAVFHNITGRTLQNLIGQCFAINPLYSGPDTLQPYLQNIDGAGIDASQQAKAALSKVLAFSRCGLFVDYPITDGPVTMRDLEDGNIRPNIILIDPTNIINWRTKRIGGKDMLSLVVIQESYTDSDDGFKQTTQPQWRVLTLDDASQYTVEVYRKDKDGKFTLHSISQPTKGDGSRFHEIPFTFIGSEKNDTNIEKPLLLDIVDLNLAHYRNSAIFEETVYINAQPTLVLNGLDQMWIKQNMSNGIMLGSKASIMLPQGGSAQMLTVPPSNLAREAMQEKVDAMKSLGAKLVENRPIPMTATEKTIDTASELSILASVVQNVSDAYTTALQWAATFLNIPTDDITYALNKEFAVNRLSDKQRTQLRADYAAGLIAFSEMREKLRADGVATLSDEDALDMIESMNEIL